jgi:tetrahydrodipicolinate N-succinyltransferase
MALVCEGLTRCPICKGIIARDDAVVAAGAFVEAKSHPLWRFNDAAMHAPCFASWSERDSFVALFNSYYAKHYRSMRIMLPDGKVVEQLPQQ